MGFIAYVVFRQRSVNASLKFILADVLIGFMAYYLFEIVWMKSVALPIDHETTLDLGLRPRDAT